MKNIRILKTKLIKLQDKFILVSDEEAMANDWITDGTRVAQVNVLTVDDPNKHLYKKIIVQDASGGLEILIDGRDLFTKFPVGRRVFIKAKGLVISDYNNLIQLGIAESEGSLAAIPYKLLDQYIEAGSLNNYIAPTIVKINEIKSEHVSMLLKFENVEFSNDELGLTYADGTNKIDANRTVTDCLDRTFILRTSGYANFANDTIPALNGDLTFVLGVFRTTYQGILRNISDVRFQNDRCDYGSHDETLVSLRSLRDQFISGQTTIDDYLKVKGIVISDRSNNNVTGRNMVIQDETAGIVIRFSANHSFDMNDEVEVVVSGLILSEYANLLQIDNTPLTNARKTGSVSIIPREATVGEILSNAEEWESTLVKVKNADIKGGSTYRDSNVSVDDGTGSIALYTRSQANFADNAIPQGKVDITAILGQFNTTYQLGIRNSDDVKGENGDEPGETLFSDDFESGIGKWNVVNVSGEQTWGHSPQYGNPGGCAIVSGYSGGQCNENEDWLITPEIDLTSIATAALAFDNATKHAGPAMEVFISDDYSGSGNPDNATWSKLSYNISPGDWAWVSSGKINLTSYNGKKIYIGFKYTSNSSTCATWEIDNVKVTR